MCWGDMEGSEEKRGNICIDMSSFFLGGEEEVLDDDAAVVGVQLVIYPLSFSANFFSFISLKKKTSFT